MTELEYQTERLRLAIERAEKAETEILRLQAALAEIERFYYQEGKLPSWRAARMNGVAADALRVQP